MLLPLPLSCRSCYVVQTQPWALGMAAVAASPADALTVSRVEWKTAPPGVAGTGWPLKTLLFT